MKIKEMIDKLQKIEDKEMTVYLYQGYEHDFPFARLKEMNIERVDGEDILVLHNYE